MSGLRQKKRKEGISDLLQCKICGTQVGYLTQKIKKVHKMSGPEYKKLYPGARLTGRRQIEYQTASTEDTGRITCQECGQKFRAITGKHTAFHGMTFQEYLEKYPDHPWKTDHVAKVWSEKARMHVLEQHKDPEFKKSLQRGIKKVAYRAHQKTKELMKDPEYARQRALSHRKGIYLYTDIFGHSVYLRSKLEIVIAYWLDFLGVRWIYEKDAFPYVHNKRVKYYVPDFSLPDHHISLEVKSIYIKTRYAEVWEKKKTSVQNLYLLLEEDIDRLGLKKARIWISWNICKGGSMAYEDIHKAIGHKLSNVSRLNHLIKNTKYMI